MGSVFSILSSSIAMVNGESILSLVINNFLLIIYDFSKAEMIGLGLCDGVQNDFDFENQLRSN